jgi:hypothetical protein
VLLVCQAFQVLKDEMDSQVQMVLQVFQVCRLKKKSNYRDNLFLLGERGFAGMPGLSIEIIVDILLCIFILNLYRSTRLTRRKR